MNQLRVNSMAEINRRHYGQENTVKKGNREIRGRVTEKT